jgi:DnaK suppressor protein
MRKNMKMNKTLDIETIRKELEERRAILSVRLRVKPNQPNTADIVNPDRSALAQAYRLKERQTALDDRLEDTLQRVEAALQRLDQGVYGRCAQCGENISAERLMALPYAENCIDCQEQS